jgi:hypothetical protein
MKNLHHKLDQENLKLRNIDDCHMRIFISGTAASISNDKIVCRAHDRSSCQRPDCRRGRRTNNYETARPGAGSELSGLRNVLI